MYKVLDIGCGEGNLLFQLRHAAFQRDTFPKHIFQIPETESTINTTASAVSFSGSSSFEPLTLPQSHWVHWQPELRLSRVAGLDIDADALSESYFHLSSAVKREQEAHVTESSGVSGGSRWDELSLELYHGSLTHYDKRLDGFDAVVATELIEHLDDETLQAFSDTVMGLYRPRLLLLTTPNYSFNYMFGNDSEDVSEHRESLPSQQTVGNTETKITSHATDIQYYESDINSRTEIEHSAQNSVSETNPSPSVWEIKKRTTKDNSHASSSAYPVVNPKHNWARSNYKDQKSFLDPTHRTQRYFRHHDHKFEWTTDEFCNWCNRQASKHAYKVVYVDAVGEATVLQDGMKCLNINPTTSPVETAKGRDATPRASHVSLLVRCDTPVENNMSKRPALSHKSDRVEGLECIWKVTEPAFTLAEPFLRPELKKHVISLVLDLVASYSCIFQVRQTCDNSDSHHQWGRNDECTSASAFCSNLEAYVPFWQLWRDLDIRKACDGRVSLFLDMLDIQKHPQYIYCDEYHVNSNQVFNLEHEGEEDNAASRIQIQQKVQVRELITLIFPDCSWYNNRNYTNSAGSIICDEVVVAASHRNSENNEPSPEWELRLSRKHLPTKNEHDSPTVSTANAALPMSTDLYLVYKGTEVKDWLSYFESFKETTDKNDDPSSALDVEEEEPVANHNRPKSSSTHIIIPDSWD